ncbi:MAG TPA: MopE-related protein, partial [Kofleriaceae bacterium]
MMRSSLAVLALLVGSALAACGPTTRNGNSGGGGDGGTNPSVCNPGDTQGCYDGQSGTSGVGPCMGGNQTCDSSGQWGACAGEVVPSQEICGDGIDNNCNGMTDEDVDADGDGYTTCGGDCCDSTECSNPKAVNPGAYDVAGDGVDNDCDGTVDNAVLSCDQSVSGQSTNGMDYAKAIDICQQTTMADPMKRWGVIDATFSLASGTGSPNKEQHAILKEYGTGITPHAGTGLALFSTGIAAGEHDPDYDASVEMSTEWGASSAFPADFLAANGGALPNAPGCPAPSGSKAGDPIMLTMHIRVPTNASSFSLDMNFL